PPPRATLFPYTTLFRSIEMAFVSVSKPQLRQLAGEGNKWADMLLQYRKNPERTLSILQICITLVGAISAAVGGAGAEESLSPIRSEEHTSELQSRENLV